MGIWFQVLTTLKQLEEFTSPYRNFYNYRHYLKNINFDLRVLPYIGIIISDLNHIFENGLIDKEGNINFETYDIIISIINNYDSFDKYYKINENKQISDFINSITDNINDAILYQLSLSITNEDKQDQLQNNESQLSIDKKTISN